MEGSSKGCSYKTFISCRLKDFYGKEEVVGALRWLEEMESVIDISDCTENYKVKYVTHSFKGEALSWYNMVVMTKGRDTVNKMSWEGVQSYGDTEVLSLQRSRED